MEPEEIQVVFVETVRRLMADRGWTQAEFTRRSGVPTGNVARLLNGKHVPSIATLAKLGELFGVDPSDLIKTEVKTKNKRK